MDPCRENEPSVIDNALLEKCLSEQAPKGEAGRLAKEEGIPIEEVEQIRLEALKILRIDHLWIMTNLKRLSLSQNLIETIENLDSLINLTELDLSFNKISKIENIDKLVNLEILSFFDNKITVLENMSTLKKLNIFSVGRNLIEDEKNVIYLRRFKNLRSLNMAGNPCADDPEFRIFVGTFLPQIVYYEYRMVKDGERELGAEIYKKKLRDLEEVEKVELEKIDKLEKAIAAAQIHSLSFVEYLGGSELFDSLFENDPEGKLLLEMGDEATDYYAEYEEEFLKVTKQIFEYGQIQYELRKKELDQFLKCIDTAKEKNQDESIKHMEIFLEKKADIFYNIKKLQEDFEDEEREEKMTVVEYNDKIEEFSNEFNDLIHDAWKKLMRLELGLYEQMEDTNQQFGMIITEMTNTFIEQSQGFFTQVRALEVTYNENIGNIGNRLLTEKTLSDNLGLPEPLEEILADREAFGNTIGASHDLHMLMIDDREDLLVNRAKTWLQDLTHDIHRGEIMRNRNKVLEITHFLDIQREEFEELISAINTAVDPDITAALANTSELKYA